MPLATTVVDAVPETCDVPFLGVFLAHTTPFPASLASLDQRVSGALSRFLAAGDFSGKRDEVAVLYPGTPERVVLVGLGAAATAMSSNALRRAASVAAKRARMLGVGQAAMFLPHEFRGDLTAGSVAQAIAEGAHQGGWHYTALKKPGEDDKAPLTDVRILMGSDANAAAQGGAMGDALGAGQTFSRDLQMLPGNTCTPSYLAQVARDLASRYGMKATILDRAAIEREGMGALLAVGQGSVQEPRFIHLEYEGAAGPPVVLVGKGITFDTGGISIKPAQNMEEMKFDMSGAAAVLGAFDALGRLRPKLHVVGLVPSAENMPSASSYKPGDVVRSMAGTTIEVVNTDAEGRLALCDALAYARRLDPACVIDAATLTGAIVIGLGHVAAGVMGTDPALVQALRDAGERAGERVWELPLWDEYRDLIKSDIADIKNSGGRPAGSITAGWFLREFTEGMSWAHLDIAGTAYTDRETPAMVKGPTGMGARLFMEFLLARG